MLAMRRAAVAAQIGNNDPAGPGEFAQQRLEHRTIGARAVQQDERRGAGTDRFGEELHAILSNPARSSA
jgi:hypothetical protein